jgi:hypothetical protein
VLSQVPTLLELLDALYRAINDRDETRVWDLLDDPRASHLPAPIREEAVTVAREPRGSFRAPIQLLRFHHMVVQVGFDPLGTLDGTRDEKQLRLPFEDDAEDVPSLRLDSSLRDAS